MLKLPVINSQAGSFLLGATSPDIRILTKWKREQTHYSSIDMGSIHEGVKGLLDQNINLMAVKDLNDQTKAFVAGYISHLISDAVWIIHIYRPYFGKGHTFVDDIESNIFDRLFQLHVDKTIMSDLHDTEDLKPLLVGSEKGVDIGFIPQDTLREWRKWVTDFMDSGFSWDRLQFMTRRIYGDNQQALTKVDQVLSSIDASLNRLYDKVGTQRINYYCDIVLNESDRMIREYLGESENNKGP